MTTICENCGKSLNNEYAYCPWCGEQHIEQPGTSYMDLLFDRYTNTNKQKKEQQIKAVGKQIEDLEQELNVLVLNAEKRKW